MARPREEDRRRIRDITAALERWEDSAEPILQGILPVLGELLDAEIPLSYAVQPVHERLRCSFLHGVKIPGALDALDTFVAKEPIGWGGYNPFSPEPHQRNRAVHITWAWQQKFRLTSVLYSFDLDQRDQLRVLVCDGPRLLAWVGAFRPEPFTAREVRLLDALVPALRRRLALESRLETRSLTTAALDALLERVGGAAFVIAKTGAVVHANHIGWTRLGKEGLELTRALAEAIRDRKDRYEVIPLSGPGLPPEYLVIERVSTGTTRARVTAAVRRFGLTARQAEVLHLVADGLTNYRIATELRISPKTVEAHVQALFDKVGCDSRAALIAAVWSTT